MTPDERAREAASLVRGGYVDLEKALADAIREAVAEEREACAAEMDNLHRQAASAEDEECWLFASEVIRARGESDEQ